MGRGLGPKKDFTDLQRLLTDAYEAARKKTGKRFLSDNEFAAMLGLPAANFNHYVNGRRAPDLVNTIKMSKYLGTDVFYAAGWDPVFSISDPMLVELINKWPTASPEKRAEIMDTLRGDRYDVYKPPKQPGQPDSDRGQGGANGAGPGDIGADPSLEKSQDD